MCEPWEDLSWTKYCQVMADKACVSICEAKEALNSFLNWDSIKFGEAGYDWCRTAAEEMAEELLLVI